MPQTLKALSFFMYTQKNILCASNGVNAGKSKKKKHQKLRINNRIVLLWK